MKLRTLLRKRPDFELELLDAAFWYWKNCECIEVADVERIANNMGIELKDGQAQTLAYWYHIEPETNKAPGDV